MGNLILATKTLEAFNTELSKDQGAAYRQNLGKVVPHLDDAYRGADDAFRSHLGASIIGKSCEREIWYSFHWTKRPSFDGRMLRLFNRGHMEEGRLIALLLTIGCEFYQQDVNGKQFRISDCAGHFSGSGDGVVIGLPDLNNGQAALAEFKTHGDKSFKKVSTEGVRAAKFEHWVQMQTYMYKMGLAVAAYFAVNKNDDHIHAEIIYLDPEFASKTLHKARVIIIAQDPPAKINKSAGWYECNFCSFKPVCKGGAQPDKNCRTCEFAKPEIEGPLAGEWVCSVDSYEHTVLTKQRQLTGCDKYTKKQSI